MNKNILVIYDDCNKNKLRKILVKSNIFGKCTFSPYMIENLDGYNIVLTCINEFKDLAEFKLCVRKVTAIPVLNIIDEGDLDIFHLIEDKCFKVIKVDFSMKSCLKNDIKILQNTLDEKVHLTAREKQILDFIAQGMSVDDISLELGISTKTVITHKRNLFVKTNVHSVNQLMFWSFNKLY